MAEELDYHVLVPDIPLEVIAEVESHPEQYPGVRIVEQSSRHYPRGTLAANVIGHLGMPEEPTASTEPDRTGLSNNDPNAGSRDKRITEKLVGRLGLERQYERGAARP